MEDLCGLSYLQCGNRSGSQNYRQAALLPVVSEVMESLIASALSNFLEGGHS